MTGESRVSFYSRSTLSPDRPSTLQTKRVTRHTKHGHSLRPGVLPLQTSDRYWLDQRHLISEVIWESGNEMLVSCIAHGSLPTGGSTDPTICLTRIDTAHTAHAA